MSAEEPIKCGIDLASSAGDVSVGVVMVQGVARIGMHMSAPWAREVARALDLGTAKRAEPSWLIAALFEYADAVEAETPKRRRRRRADA